MYFWEWLSSNPYILIVLLFVIGYPLILVLMVALFTNPYWKKLNDKQKGYWFIALITGTSIAISSMLIIMCFFLMIWIRFTIYIEALDNLLIKILFFISMFSFIILLFYKMKQFTKMTNKIFGKPLEFWEKVLKPMDINLYFKEEKPNDN